MMLVQKQAFAPPHPVAAPHFQHRRHPSAPPAVVVQPTRTPGLLAISKPQKASPQRQMPSNQRKGGQKPRQTTRTNPAEISDKRPALAVLQAPASPSPVRARVAPKDRTNRSKHGRQPSPPVEVQQTHQPSQAEDPSSNSFNPFLESSPSDSIPVPSAPRPQHNNNHQLARSAPTPSNMRKPTKGPRFPVCDDTADDSSEAETPPPRTPPATPPRPSHKAPAGFPFTYPVSPQTLPKTKRHRRSPSEGVFAMSSDDDAPASEQALLAFARNRNMNKFPSTPPSMSRVSAPPMFNGSAQTAAYFASSLFQNSPSPDELPDPTLF